MPCEWHSNPTKFFDFVNCWPKFAQVKIANFIMFTDSAENFNVNVERHSTYALWMAWKLDKIFLISSTVGKNLPKWKSQLSWCSSIHLKIIMWMYKDIVHMPCEWHRNRIKFFSYPQLLPKICSSGNRNFHNVHRFTTKW
jgi:hypothetical protein